MHELMENGMLDKSMLEVKLAFFVQKKNILQSVLNKFSTS